MNKKSGGLNKAKGLDALISANRGSSTVKLQASPYLKKEAEEVSNGKSVISVNINSIVPNKEQPRKEFNEEALMELAESIKQYGVIVPLIVQKKDKYYEIIAGERRWRASKLAGLKEMPVIVNEYTDREVAEIALIENIQREDLNAIEEANAYKRLIEEFELTQEEVASKVAKSRTAVTNALRLLKLDERVQKLLIDGMLSMGHARALLSIEHCETQFDVANMVIGRKMSVRETESYVKRLHKVKPDKEPKDTLQMDTIYEGIEESLKAKFGTKVSIKRKKSGKGAIEIEYYSADEFDRIMALLKKID